jgi:uncharacterized protein (TIGR03067 family)
MRTRMSALLAVFIAVPLTLAVEPSMPLTPAEAAKKVNEQVTLQMDVKAAAKVGTNCFLNSEENYRDAKTFTVFINKDTLEKFKTAKIDDPAAHFRGKTIQVTGKVVLYQNRPEIVLAGPDAIKIVGDPEMAKLEGEWAMVSGTANGMDMPADMVKSAKRVAKDGVTTVTIDGQVYLKAKFTIDQSKKLKTIDYDMTEGPTAGKKQLGIYKVDGDTMTFCFAAPGEARPTEFTAPPGSDRTLGVWKKEKK